MQQVWSIMVYFVGRPVPSHHRCRGEAWPNSVKDFHWCMDDLLKIALVASSLTLSQFIPKFGSLHEIGVVDHPHVGLH
jgi:hypothetical protein